MDQLGPDQGTDQEGRLPGPLGYSPQVTVKPAPQAAAAAGTVIIDGMQFAPAGFWLRFMAFLVDMLILGALSAIILRIVNLPPTDLGRLLEVSSKFFEALAKGGFPSMATMNELSELQRPGEFAGWVHIAMCCAYFTIFHGLLGASLGKLCLGLRLLRSDGRETGLGMAFLRYLAYLLVARLVYTAWIMPFDAQRRTLYDMVLKTNVYKKFGTCPGTVVPWQS